MPIERRPANPLPRGARPGSRAQPHRVVDGETLESVAKKYGLGINQLIQHNFATLDPAEINWYLREHVGCTLPTKDGKNWRFSSIARPGLIYLPANTMRTQSTLPADLAPFEAQLRQEIAKEKAAHWEEFLTSLTDLAKVFKVGSYVAGRVEDARKIAQFYAFLRSIGLPSSEITEVLKVVFVGDTSYLARNPQYAKAILDDITAPTGKLRPVFKNLKFAGDALKFTKFLINYAVDWSRGDYVTAWAEIYKTAMGKAIPWAGLVDSTEGFITAIWPDSKNSTFWKYLRAANLVGLGGDAVDALGVVLQSIFQDGINPVNWDVARIKRLEDRMRASPGKIFVEIGDDLSKALDEVAAMSPGEFDEMMTATNVYNWLRYTVTGKMPGE